jgi:hypothetical protein
MVNFTKSRPLEIEMFHADGRTNMLKLTVTLRDYANESKIDSNLLRILKSQ